MLAPNPTVFVVDDYAPVRRSISRLLHTAGFAVAAFASAGEFLAQYDPQTLGCLVLDLAMPTVNGLELQRILAKGRQSPAHNFPDRSRGYSEERPGDETWGE